MPTRVYNGSVTQPRRLAGSLLLVGLAGVLLGGQPAADPASGAAPGEPAAVLDALFPGGRRTEALARLAEGELAPEEAVRVSELGRDASTSHHLVRIRDREELHRHDRHDLLVVVLRGHGTMRLGEEERSVGEGSILYVPRGVAHAFRNQSHEPAAAYGVYTPPFDGRDRVPVTGEGRAP
jgi:mannose-6-phosphate isomerase-like protein (cupin superfamily)